MATTAAQRRPTVWDLELAAVAAVAALIVATRAYNYLLFHTLAELFSVVVGLTAFSIAWNTRRTLDTPFLLVVGLTFGPVAIVDLLHTLAFKGMGVFTGFDANLPTQLWIAGRILEVGGLVAASLWSRRRPAAGLVLAAGMAGLALLLGAIFWLEIFPDCWREGQGLTPFKIAAEYLFMAVLALALGRLLLRRRRFHPDLFPYIVASVVLVIVEEACFTLYSDVYGVFNMAGHIAKIAVYYMVYAGLVRFGFAVPQETLYRQLSALNARLADDALRSNERAALAVAASDGAAWEWDMRSPAVVLRIYAKTTARSGFRGEMV
ncbi:MAG: hypothetical protein HY985_13655 [Magnetospirillum sp.]|nr:hypothetical protein [Magnetospirillum sp.]